MIIAPALGSASNGVRAANLPKPPGKACFKLPHVNFLSLTLHARSSLVPAGFQCGFAMVPIRKETRHEMGPFAPLCPHGGLQSHHRSRCSPSAPHSSFRPNGQFAMLNSNFLSVPSWSINGPTPSLWTPPGTLVQPARVKWVSGLTCSHVRAPVFRHLGRN